jgi:hypothetical protein
MDHQHNHLQLQKPGKDSLVTRLGNTHWKTTDVCSFKNIMWILLITVWRKIGKFSSRKLFPSLPRNDNRFFLFMEMASMGFWICLSRLRPGYMLIKLTLYMLRPKNIKKRSWKKMP